MNSILLWKSWHVNVSCRDIVLLVLCRPFVPTTKHILSGLLPASVKSRLNTASTTCGGVHVWFLNQGATRVLKRNESGQMGVGGGTRHASTCTVNCGIFLVRWRRPLQGSFDLRHAFIMWRLGVDRMWHSPRRKQRALDPRFRLGNQLLFCWNQNIRVVE